MKYRPEIDGLRAIAVLSVIFYHAGFLGFSGGFVGVDIFFVISGFLISNILIEKISNKNFSYVDFYERRARRIMPMVFAMIFVSIPLGLLTMLTEPFEDFSETILSSIFFYSNFFFWDNGGYWGGDNALKPLLHTWSLSVEEQFYILFPPLLFLCFKYFKNHLINILVLGFIASLIAAEWASHNYPLASFFLLPTRAFELLAGAVLAGIQHKHGRENLKFIRLMPVLGVLMIIGSVVLFKDTMFHPSFLTLIPVVGAMLIIWFARGEELVTKLLSSRLFVGIGLISYSLYLWHHIFFSFARIKMSDDLSTFSMIGLIVLTLIFSYFSWRFIERPFRDKEKIGTKTFWIITLLVTIFLSAFALISKEMNGFPERLPSLARLANAAADKSQAILYVDGKKCDNRPIEDVCSLGPEKAKTNWVLLGDSHMSLLSKAFWEEVKLLNGQLSTYIDDSCFYAPGLEAMQNGKPEGCGYKGNMQRREKLLAMNPQIIVMGGRMPLYLSGQWFNNGEGGIESKSHFYMRPYNQDLSDDDRQQAVKDAVKEGVNELLKVGHKVVLIYPIPEVGVDVPKSIGKVAMSQTSKEAQAWMDEGGVTTSYTVYQNRNADTYALYDSIDNNPNLLRIYPDKIFCNIKIKDRCSTHGLEGIYYSDDDHLSLIGAKKLVGEMMKQIKERWNL